MREGAETSGLSSVRPIHLDSTSVSVYHEPADATGVLHVGHSKDHVGEGQLAKSTRRWIVASYWVELAAWQALVDRLGWQVYVSNTTSEQNRWGQSR